MENDEVKQHNNILFPDTNLEENDINNIPLADDDPQALIPDSEPEASGSSKSSSDLNLVGLSRKFDSIPSVFTHDSLSSADLDPDEQEEKARLISQVLELQNTLDDLSQRVDTVQEENLKLRSENQVLGQYIESLMSASSVFQPTSPKNKKKLGR